MITHVIVLDSVVFVTLMCEYTLYLYVVVSVFWCVCVCVCVCVCECVCSHQIGEILWKIKNGVERAVLFCVC
jgi:hypothetical protein